MGVKPIHYSCGQGTSFPRSCVVMRDGLVGIVSDGVNASTLIGGMHTFIGELIVLIGKTFLITVT